MYYPNLELPEEEMPQYGRMRHTYLREHKKAYYTTLLFDGKLVAHLNEIDDAANTQVELIIKQMRKSQGISEALKVQDQVGWVGAMNHIHSASEEIVLSELIFRICTHRAHHRSINPRFENRGFSIYIQCKTSVKVQ